MANDSELTYGALRRQLLWLRLALAGLALAWLASVAWLAMRPPPAVLAVERLDILEPDGRPALILANSQRPAPATIDGQIVMGDQVEERRGSPSIIFFDGKGDEVGGMMFGSTTSPNGYGAYRHLSFDAHDQDQTLVLSHNQDQDGATAGLRVNDQPKHSMLETFARLGLAPGATRAELTAALQAIPESERAARRAELFGIQRAFFGSARSGDARLELRDGAGRVRIVLEAPRDGDPSIRVLDAGGGVVARLPE